MERIEIIEKKIRELIPDMSQKGKYSEKRRKEAATLLLEKAENLGDAQEKVKTLTLAGSLAPLEASLQVKIAKQCLKEEVAPSFFQLACEKLEEAQALEPQNTEVLSLLIHALCKLSEADASMASLKQAAQLFEKLKEATKDEEVFLCLEGKIGSLRASFSQEVSDYHQALVAFRRAEELGVLKGEFFFDYAKTLFQIYQISPLKEYLVEGQILLHQGLREVSNKRPLLHLALQFALEEFYFSYDASAFEEAKRIYNTFQKEERLDPKPHFEMTKAILFQGWFLRNEEILEKVIERLEVLQKTFPNMPEGLYLSSLAHVHLGEIKEDLGDIRLGEKYALELMEKDASSLGLEAFGFACLALGHYFNEPDEFIKAYDTFLEALDNWPHREEALLGLCSAQIYVGVYHHSSQLIAEAVDNLEKANLSQGYLAPFFFKELGVSYFFLSEDGLSEEEDLIAAIDYMERALSFFDSYPYEDPDLLFHLGCASDFLGDVALADNISYYEKAIESLQKSLCYREDDYEARAHLAIACSHLGEISQDSEKLEEASALFATLSEENPEDERVFLEWGIALMVLSQLMQDPNFLEASFPFLQASEEKLKKSCSLGALQAFYHLSCLYSLAGDFATSLAFLEEGYRRECLPQLDEILIDEYLEGLRETVEFQNWIANKMP